MSVEPQTAAAPASKWWGWGDPQLRIPLAPSARAILRERAGEAAPSRPVALEQVAIPAPRNLPEAIAATVGAAGVLVAHEQRVRRSTGRGYPDLVRLRSGRLAGAPDAVVMPGRVEQVADVLAACAGEGVAVVPFGGGTSVVGGVEPLAGGHERVISLDLRRMRTVDVDAESLTARLGPGLRGPEAEAALRERGLTLGHFPQSFEYATIGGFAATRSAGQASAGYGRFDEMVTSLAAITPAGELRTLATPHSAAGPALRELIIGSEGVLGAITEVTARVRRAPAARRFEGWIAPDFATGRELVRGLAQGGALPDVTRLSDRAETEISFGLAGTAGARRRLLGGYLALRRRRRGCLLICGWEGERDQLEHRRAVSTRLLRSGDAAYLGQAPGRAWERERFRGPYLRDELMDLGYMVETLETAHAWSRLEALYGELRAALDAALRAQGTPGIVTCHLSHAYRDGASLYFTFIAPALPGAEIEQWRAVKAAACETIVAAGGTITHHHAVGRDHAPYMPAEVGATGLELLRTVKRRLDPAAIMNPGKLLPS